MAVLCNTGSARTHVERKRRIHRVRHLDQEFARLLERKVMVVLEAWTKRKDNLVIATPSATLASTHHLQ